MKSFLRVMLILLVVCGFLALGFISLRANVKNANDHWNNGVCEVCGGAYKFTSATHVRNGGTRYYYTCEDCDHTIMTYSLMK